MKTISNNDIRKFVYENIMQYTSGKEDGVLNNSYEEYSKKLNDTRDIPFMSILYPAIVSIAYTDAYLVLNMKMKLNDISSSDKELFNTIKFISNYEELVDAIDNDNTLLPRLLEKSTSFYDMSYLRKIIAMNSLTLAQQNFLLLNYSLFENDFEEYNEDVTINTLGDYCKEEFEDYVSINGDYELENFEDNLTDEMNGLVNFLVGNNIDLYLYIMGKLLEIDYKWNKYLIDHNIYSETEHIYADRRIEMYEKRNHNELIKNECMINFAYVEELLTSFIMIKCYNMNIDPRFINQEKIDEYFSNRNTLNKGK